MTVFTAVGREGASCVQTAAIASCLVERAHVAAMFAVRPAARVLTEPRSCA